MSAPRVLFVASVARHLLAFHLPFVRLLQDMGCEVHAACDPAGEGEELAAAGVKVWPLPIRRSPWRPENLWALGKLVRLMKGQGYRLVHVHTPVAACLGRVAARLAGVPAVLYTAHGFHFYRGAPLVNWLLYYPVEWWLARWTDGLFVMNREDHERALRLPVRGRVYLVPGVGVPLEDGPDPGARARELAALGVPPEAPVAIVAGELSPTKNVGQVLRAWRLVLDQLPHAWLLVVGEGSQRRRLERLARRLGLSSNVVFCGFRKDLRRLLHLTDVLVTASRREGLPRVVMEAMAAGRPVVATDVRGNRDLVSHGETGMLVAPGEAAAMGAALLTVLGDAGVRCRLGNRARERAQTLELCRAEQALEPIYRQFLGRQTC